MAAAKDTTRTRVEHIKADLRSISTCTATTIAEIQRLFASPPDEPAQKENVRVKSSQLVSVQKTARKTKVSTTTKTTKTTIEVATPAPACLTPREKYIAATETVNSTLKLLADALKHTPAPTSRAPADEDLRRPPKQRAAPSKRSPTPLRERSASQAGNSPTKPSLSRCPSHTPALATGHEPGLVETAECARIAFAYLRTPEALKTAGKDSPALQLENGMLAFVGKLVAHGLDMLAIKELRILKRRLDRFIGTRNLAASAGVEKEGLASLLDFGIVNRTSSALPLVVTHQMYTLRIMGRTRRSGVIEEAWEHLRLSNPASPAALLSDLASVPGNETKTTRQLESLAQSILALCPSNTSPVNHTIDRVQLPLSPDVLFRLQNLAFSIRQSWWRLAKHQVDEEKELLVPFTKCLITFAKRSQLPPSETYEIAKSSYEQLLGQIGSPLVIQSKYPASADTSTKCMGSLAQSAGRTKEALRWLNGAHSLPNTKHSAARRATDNIKVATLAIDAALKDSSPRDIEELANTAVESLSGDLLGSSEELDCLFRETSSLRRLASRALLPNSATPSGATITPADRYQLVRIIAASVHLCVRYSSRDTNGLGEEHYLLRFDQVSKSAKSILDSVLMCAKTAMEIDKYWPTLDGLLQDGVAIATQCEENSASPHVGTPDNLRMPFVRLSNAYWGISTQLKSLGEMQISCVTAMKRSTDVLIPRPPNERQSGLLAMKMEKLADMLDSTGETEASRDAYVQCLREQIECGLLREAASLATNLPLGDILDRNRAPAVLGRVLKAYHRSFVASTTKNPDEQGFYDNGDLVDSERSVILEWQLMLYLKTLCRNRDWGSTLHAPTRQIAQALCEVYNPAIFPIRSLRMRIIFFQLSQEYPGIIAPELLHELATLPTHEESLQHQDSNLLAYEKHLEAMVRLKSELRKESPSINYLQQCIAVWQSLVESASSWDAICAKVDNPEYWILSLQELNDFLAARGEDYICLHVLHLIVKILETKKDTDLSLLASILSTLGLQFLRLGYSGKAGLALARAENLVSQGKISTEAKLQWHICYAEYLLQIGNSSKCEATLRIAQTIAHGDSGFMSLAKPTTSLSGMVRYNRILANACHVSSMLALTTGQHQSSARYAKQSVVLNRRIWSALEGKLALRKAAPPEDADASGLASSKASFDPLASVRDDKGRPVVKSMTHESLRGTEFWPLVPCLYRAMMQHSLIYEHEGLIQEATFVAEQAEKIASATQARSLLMDNASSQAEYWAQSGRCAKAQSALNRVDTTYIEKQPSTIKYYSSIAKMHHCGGNFADELATYETLGNLLASLSSPSFINTLDIFSPDVDVLEHQLSAMSISEPVARPQKLVRSTNTTKSAARSSRRSPAAPKSKVASVSEECLPLSKHLADIARRKALALLLQHNTSAAMQLLDQAKAFEKGLESSVQHLWVSYKTALSTAMSELAKDFTYNTLAESTIAFPAITQKDVRSSDGATARKPPTTASSARITKGAKSKESAKEAFIATLRQAREHLSEAHRLCSRAGSTVDLQQTSSALGQITVLLSALSVAESRGSVHPLYAAYMSELPKIYSLRIAQESIDVETESSSRNDISKWPEEDAPDSAALVSVSDFQNKFIDIIPQSWTAISLSLNETLDELYLTRFDAGHTPFVLRIPLARHSSRDMDEDQFSFEDGKREFEEIIELSDFSTRSAKDMTSKESRAQWWDERDALDEKLRGLLVNMENIWFGGFKGMFSLHPRQTALLARFRKSFDNILTRHLPSRQGKSKPKRPILDARVLELFVGLGDATDDTLDLDEPLEDLVYFVVDILQFNGEHNAYDEIDFDTIVLETHDALRAYHNAAKNVAAEKTHLILILDKNLHMFPWESMPCLQSISISRLPSLAALRERILASKPSMGQDSQPGHHISALAGGTSMLNPSADLSHTTKTLKPRLDQMQGSWNNIIDRAPTEKEFEGALKDNELVLYFGHGSGAQYVRSKYVRRLYSSRQPEESLKPACATTFLFGCSSVHLSDNGVYEPSGMLASYLTAGAPAVLGMLWDVTDKDCDRFAVKAGKLWGLWPEPKEESEGKIAAPAATRKGKGKVAQLVADVEGARSAKTPKRGRKKEQLAAEGTQPGAIEKGWRRGVGLDEAVREARDACVLRYLNGAAAVVYGIPVYLE